MDKEDRRLKPRQESLEEYRLQQYLKWNSWEMIYYRLSSTSRKQLFMWLRPSIEEWKQTK